ncbi:exosortase/archaeosortase family protein [Desulfobacterota bacterium M19]
METLRSNNRGINIGGLTVIGLLIALTYHTTILWMYQRYMGVDSYYSHGFIVPFVSLFFIYQQKDILQRTPQRASLTGLFILIFALLLHILGTALYVFSISGFSLFFLFIGLTLFLFGWERTKIIWFPLVFLVFMFPLPMAMVSAVAFPLKILAAKAGVWIVSALGIPIYGEGFNIFIPAGHLLVGNPCSGLRSLIAFMALGSICAYMASLSNIKKWFVFLLAIPIALLSNFIRVPILILASHYWGLKAAAPGTFVHTGSGMLVFIVGFLLLLASVKVLE